MNRSVCRADSPRTDRLLPHGKSRYCRVDMKSISLLISATVCLAISGSTTTAKESNRDQANSGEVNGFASYRQKAGEFNAVLQLPEFETTSKEVKASIKGAIKQANARLDQIGKLKAREVTFENTIMALDTLLFHADKVANRIYLIKETHPDAEMRKTATRMIKQYQNWKVGLDYREDVYQAIKAFADQEPDLHSEDAKLLKETMRDYRRAGLNLSKSKQSEVEALRKELAGLTTDYDSNITKAEKALHFSKEELAGVPDRFLSNPDIKTGENEYTVMANITWHFMTVMENAKKESTRKRLQIARYNLAKEKNVPLLKKILKLRAQIAAKLGYDSWADYRIEPRMAENAAKAQDFLKRLQDGLQPKFKEELAAFRELKADDTGRSEPTIHMWDWRYYSEQLKSERYSVNTEKLRSYFPYSQVLKGMFEIFESLFGLTIQRVAPPYKWVDNLRLYVVSDSDSGKPMGAFYLDMFPRKGKYNHFAQFGITPGKRLSDGRYQRPVVALICNFPSPQGDDTPSLLSHQQVETLFHEFGHALHSILTEADYKRFSGTSVARDFVEAPSQMLENWVWEKEVLDTFAAHYKDPSKKIPQETLQQMEAAKHATIATWYRRQLAFGLLDLELHDKQPSAQSWKPVATSNEIINDVFLPVPEDTAFVASFGHLTGYDAGYYGYAWADAIAADMNTVFENAENDYFDKEAGRRLRNRIYAPGGSKEPNELVQDFLGRSRSITPFLRSLGIKTEDRN